MLRLLVNTNNPSIMSMIPIAGLKYFRYFTILLIMFVACEKNKPVTKNGMPSPSEYANNKL